MSSSTILIADDDENDVILLKRALKSAKIMNPVHVVPNGEEVIHYLKGSGAYADRVKFPHPVLLFLNLQMPVMTGAEVLAWLQTERSLPPLQVIVLTGHCSPKQVQEAMRLGASFFLQKPPESRKLLELFQKMQQVRLEPFDSGASLRLTQIAGALLVRSLFPG